MIKFCLSIWLVFKMIQTWPVVRKCVLLCFFVFYNYLLVDWVFWHIGFQLQHHPFFFLFPVCLYFCLAMTMGFYYVYFCQSMITSFYRRILQGLLSCCLRSFTHRKWVNTQDLGLSSHLKDLHLDHHTWIGWKKNLATDQIWTRDLISLVGMSTSGLPNH